MQPVSLWIEGSFWDSQIYSGELLLLDNDGAIHRVDWNAIIDGLASANPQTQTALRVAFSDSDLFYTQKVRKILRDPSIENVIRQQLRELESLSVVAGRQAWARHWRVSAAPFSFLPIDTDIYYNHLLASGDEGLFSSPRGHASLSGKAVKHHDGRVLQIKASNQNTAVAAAGGADGLFEFQFQVKSEDVLDDPRRLATIPCSACDWAFQSIVAWSTDSAYFANFRQEEDPQSHRKVRSFDRIIRQQQIFGEDASRVHGTERVWGSHEKLFRLLDDKLEVLQYAAPRPLKGKKNAFPDAGAGDELSYFSSHGQLSLNFDSRALVSTGTAPFGSVLEFPDRIVVLRSDGKVEVFDDEEPVHWRVFPRSEHYGNQLHIIYPDRMRIVSFVHDYFVEQTTKLTGFAKGSNDYIVSGKSSKSSSLVN